MRKSLHSPLKISSAALIAAAASTSLALLPDDAHAYTLKTLHSFCNTANCGDGEAPLAGLLMDASGALYGVTEQGGKYGRGLVFKLIPNANKTKYTEHILKNFCSEAGCPGGSFPNFAGLIMDVDGNLYGSTATGGKFDAGVIFKMRPITNGWVYGVIHSFCADPNCTDGYDPASRLAYAGQASGALWDESSPLFGTTISGGAQNKGAVFKLTPNGSGWNYQVIHSYSSGVQGGALVADSSGNLFGTTYVGGANASGTLYRLAAGTWSEATLHNFCAETNCTDGSRPSGTLALDAAGNLFGTAQDGGGGANCVSVSGCGVVFERTAGGKFTVLYNFCSKTGCKDGIGPESGLILDTNGTLFGTTYSGGTGPGSIGPGGTVFSLTHGSPWNETVLYDFCSAPNCTDGSGPLAPLIVNASGSLFGTTVNSGANGNGGTVFKLKP